MPPSPIVLKTFPAKPAFCGKTIITETAILFGEFILKAAMEEPRKGAKDSKTKLERLCLSNLLIHPAGECFLTFSPHFSS